MTLSSRGGRGGRSARGGRWPWSRGGGVRPLRSRSGFVPSSSWRSPSRVRRASAGWTRSRTGGLLLLAVAVGGLYALTTSTAFRLTRTQLTGAAWTAQDEILAALAVPAGQSAFTLSTTELAARLASVAAIRSATIRVELPDQLVVTVTERQPVVVWEIGGQQYLVDADGLLFDPLPSPVPPEAATLPVVDDRRAASVAMATGSHLDSVTLDAALRLGSLTPADLGSAASGLSVRIDDQDGFTITAGPGGWTAVFGFYTPSLRTTALIPGQVRLLRSLLYGQEAKVLRVVLADDRSGTYIPRAAASAKPAPASSAKPGASPGATARPSSKP